MADELTHQRLLAIASAIGGPLLGFDTSGSSASICTVGWRDGTVEELELPAGALPSEFLAQALVDAIARAGFRVRDLRGIVIGSGPGSFTGLRVGLATAKGMALGADVSLFGTSSLAMLAAAHGPGLIAPVVDARRNEVFGAVYQVANGGDVESIVADGAFSPARFVARLEEARSGSVTVVGTGAATCLPSGPPPDTTVIPGAAIRAAYGILHAEGRIRRGDGDPIDTLAPRYLKASEAERELGQPPPTA
ncbi:MAG: tRNA (adenosine(37)-N6)-threonylcarbamoyltransferase complex dimerization subunit type 1 TsaB [Myxococcota bacterium]